MGEAIKNKKILLPLLIKVFLLILIILSFAYFSYMVAYADKAYPNIFVAKERIGGLTQEEVRQKIIAKIKNQEPRTIKFIYQGEEILKIKPAEIDLNYDVEKTISMIWAYGRRPSLWTSLKEPVILLFSPCYLPIQISYDQEKFNSKVQEITQKINVPMEAYSFYLEDGEIKEKEPKEGMAVLEKDLKNDFNQKVGNLEDAIEIKVEKLIPKVLGNEEQIKEAREKFSKIISSSIIFVFQDQKFTAGIDEISKWVEFFEREVAPNKYILDVKISEQKISRFLKTIAQKINKEPKDAKLTISDGRAVVFQAEEDGYKLDEVDALNKVSHAVFSDNRTINLKVEIIKPKIRTATINDLGIKELIGEGSSSFGGSPKNRIHNITIGASLFNGVLIPPGGIFSFNQVLGDVSPSRGFLPELVIKEDRLIPETGGGLCQVSTTMFRAALYSGLEILERTPHSFRVRYYEPPVGLDATVYNPKPDLKFKNDTPGYILIQTKIEGTKLTFQFYGTRDGRRVEIKGPYTSGYRAPGPPVYIDDPSLPAGQIKQIEKAVPGLTATIYWTVYKEGKILHQKTFISKYVPWPAKYKRGTGGIIPQPPSVEQPPAEQPPPEQPLPEPPSE